MDKIVVRNTEEVEPTIFKSRESRRLISPERDNSKRMSLHEIKRFVNGISQEVKYLNNDELLYILEGKGYILEDDNTRHPFKPGTCVFIPENTTYKIYNTENIKMIAILSPPRYLEEWKNREDLMILEPGTS